MAALSSGHTADSPSWSNRRKAKLPLWFEPFFPHRRLHSGTRGDALAVGRQSRKSAQRNLREINPAQDHEQICVGDGETVAHKEIVIGEMGSHMSEPSFDGFSGLDLEGVITVVKDRPERFV